MRFRIYYRHEKWEFKVITVDIIDTTRARAKYIPEFWYYTLGFNTNDSYYYIQIFIDLFRPTNNETHKGKKKSNIADQTTINAI